MDSPVQQCSGLFYIYRLGTLCHAKGFNMLQMLRDKVLVQPIIRKLSDIIEVKNTERFNLGIVIAVGPGAYDKNGNVIPLDVKVGDTVRFGEFSFPKYERDGIEYTIIQEADVAAVVE